MRKLLHFSEAASLALHSLEIIAKEGGRLHTVKNLAGRLNCSEAHLAKVFQRLAKTGLVHSYRGPGGGFLLSRNPDQITLLEIFNAMEGSIDFGSCPMMKETCPFEECMFSGLLDRFQQEFRNFVETNTLADVVAKYVI